MPQLRLLLLGSLEVTLDGRPVSEFPTDKTRALLAYLAMQKGQAATREMLAALLWPEQPGERSRQSLRQTLNYLRGALGTAAASLLQVDRDSIGLCGEDVWVDALALAAEANACHVHRHRGAARCLPCLWRLEHVVALYRGEFCARLALPDAEGFEEWALARREWLRREAVEALGTLAGYHEARGEFGVAERLARRQVEMEPWQEEAHQQVMRLLALQGRRGAALAQFETCRHSLLAELGVEPAEEADGLRRLIAAGQIQATVSPGLGLPPTEALVGREADLTELGRRLSAPGCRLLTLVGLGGVGKSRLAEAAAEAQRGLWRDGVRWVSLQGAADGHELVAHVARAVGLSLGGEQPPAVQLRDWLSNKELLLVLDNMEHLLAAGELLSDWLRRSAGLSLLVTSRQRLSLAGEEVYEVDGLGVPAADDKGDEGHHGSLVLFAARAQAVNRLALAEEAQRQAAVHICRLVEGLPLALELAAAWTPLRSCTAIAAALETGLELLRSDLSGTPERQVSVRATFEYSWRLLEPAESAAFARLGVFRGGFTAQAARAVAGAEQALLDGLVAKSMVRRRGARYGLHELLRQFAEEKLATDARQRHARWYTRYVGERAAALQGPGQLEAVRELAVEMDNVRVAWEEAVAGGHIALLDEALDGLYRFFDSQGRFAEGDHLLAQALPMCRQTGGAPAVLARLLARRGALLRRLGRSSEALEALSEALSLAGGPERRGERLFGLVHLADLARSLGDEVTAGAQAEEALTLARETRDLWGQAFALFLLGVGRYRGGELGAAEALLSESLAAARLSGDRRLVMQALNTLGDVACHHGDLEGGGRAFRECLAICREIGDRYWEAVFLNNLGTVEYVSGCYAEACERALQSARICRDTGDRVGESIALSNLSDATLSLGRPGEALAQALEGLEIARQAEDRWAILACLNSAGEAASLLGNWRTAQRCLRDSVTLAWETQALNLLLAALLKVGLLWLRQGRMEEAAPVLALVRGHEAAEQDVRARAARLLAEAGREGTDALQESLEAIAHRLQAMLKE
ncbi:MAG: tetratricopeptide repeat protein [Anaerolineae bacterium]